ncbi:MAG: DUF4304 domain-containing protein [Candidatus Paceibacterota bacterium]|jgi:hypothetical protein
MFNFFKNKDTKISLRQGRMLMDKALKDFVVPEIKGRGFFGSYPHFRREKNGRYEFLSFQFSLHGGNFVVEAAYVTRENLPLLFRELPFTKLTHAHTSTRRRIPTGSDIQDGFGYSFEKFINENQFEDLAKLVITQLSQLDIFLS